MTSARPLPEETLTTEVAVRTREGRPHRQAGRSTGGQRCYAAVDLDWIAFVLSPRDTGVSIRRLRASGRALDEKNTHYEKSLEEQ